MGVGPGYTQLSKIQRGMVWDRPRNCLPSEEKVGLYPLYCSPNHGKTQTTESMVGQTSQQEVCHQTDFDPSGEGAGMMALADPGGIGTQREPLEPTPHGSPRTEDV